MAAGAVFILIPSGSCRQNAWLLPGEAPCRVCVLCGAENMTDQAQNALLKILEEPPEHTVFILTAENRSMLLPTILSRVQTIRLEPLTPAEILPVLRERCPDQPGEKLEWRQKQRIPLSGIGAAGGRKPAEACPAGPADAGTALQWQ